MLVFIQKRQSDRVGSSSTQSSHSLEKKGRGIKEKFTFMLLHCCIEVPNWRSSKKRGKKEGKKREKRGKKEGKKREKRGEKEGKKRGKL